MDRLIDQVIKQMPERLRGRFIIKVKSDPYHLRVEVIARTITEPPEEPDEYTTGPLEVTWVDGTPRIEVPGWFLGHLCVLRTTRTFRSDLWDSLAQLDDDERGRDQTEDQEDSRQVP